MSAPPRQPWLFAALVVGVAFAVHIGYELFRRRNPPRRLALHAAVAVAIGAVALAVAGMNYAGSTASAT